MSRQRTTLVTGATGQQGGAVARALLTRGHRVSALTRNPDSPAARALQQLGAHLVAGSFDEPASLANAAEGADAVFAVSTFFEGGLEAETRQGIAIADAAKAAGVQHLVYNSVANADQNTSIPHFDSKYRVEQHIQAIGVPHTIIGPVYFFDNMYGPFVLPGLQQGTLEQALPADRALQGVAVADIGAFAALVLEHRDEFLGRRVDIGSEELTGREYATAIARASGLPISYSEVPLAQIRAMNQDAATMMEWLNRVGYSADIAGLRHDYPEVGWHTFAQWAEVQDWSVLDRAA
ncbi:MAG: nucleoside-diphosphate sugar epimerase [Dehalococcoidia bacterium]|nr:nucleoside-diphosphate sugar epimerase [Dehalococcoidia bacterium]